MSIGVLTCVTGEPNSLTSTLDSIKPLLTNSFQWILKFSSNTTTPFIRKFERENIIIIQKPDNCLYEAMNQGLESIKHELYFVIGAGDKILPEGARKITETTSNTLHSEILAPIYVESSKTTLHPNPSLMPDRMSCPHPGAILRTSRSLEIGGFNTDYRIASDYDHLSRYFLKFGKPNTNQLPALVYFSAGGMSENRALEGYLEEELIRKRVWKSTDISIYGRMLERSTTVISSAIRRNNPPKKQT